MGLLHSSSPIVIDGLAYALDAGNTKSYPGRPTSMSSNPWFDLIGHNLNDESLYGPRLINLNQIPNDWSYADGAITLSGPLTLNFPVVSHTSAWTWECWVRFNSWGAASAGYLFRAYSVGNTEGFYVEQSSFSSFQGRPFLERNNGSGASGSNSILMPDPIALGDWSHLVCTGTTGAPYYMYYNGNNVGSYSSSTAFQPQQMHTIGGSSTDLSFGQVRVYDRELSASEVEQNFNAHRARYGL